MTQSLNANPPQVFPEDLFTQKESIGQWRVAKTKSRREKALAGFLCSRGLAYYLPMIKKRQPGKGRVRYSLVPVFSGYVFFRSGDNERYQAFTSGHMAGVIEVKDEASLLKDLDQVRRAINLDAPLYPYDFVASGDEVEITAGPFKGLQGIIQRKKNNFRLILNIECLSRSLALDIEADMVQPLNLGLTV